MAAIDFPNSPTVDQEFTSGDRTWIWDGSVWNAKSSSVPQVLDDLGDVVITTPSSGQAVTYNGTNWVNSTLTSLPSQTGNTGELLITNGTAASWSNTVTANAAATVGLVVKGATSQSANLQQWQNSSGSTIAYVTQSGSIYSSNTISGTSIAGAPATPANDRTSSNVGFIGMPQTSTSTGLSLTAEHAGKHIYTTVTGQTHTIPANGSVPLEIGTTIVFINPASVTTSIAITSDTLLLAGAGTTGTRTLAPYGMATAVKITSTSWMISGNGLS